MIPGLIQTYFKLKSLRFAAEDMPVFKIQTLYFCSWNVRSVSSFFRVKSHLL